MDIPAQQHSASRNHGADDLLAILEEALEITAEMDEIIHFIYSDGRE